MESITGQIKYLRDEIAARDNQLMFGLVVFATLIAASFITAAASGKQLLYRLMIVLLLAYNFTVGAAEYYGFKYYFNNYHINEVTYGFSVWLISLLVLFLAVLFSAKGMTLLSTIRRRPEFLGAITLSKSFDAAQWWLYLHSLSLAAVSQVGATSELYTLMLVVIIYIAQNLFKFKAEEKFSRGHLAFKLAAVVLLVLGGYFIR